VTSRLELSRAEILAFRRRVGALDGRLPREAGSLRRAAWAGLQDSMPRAAVLSVHARVDGTGPTAWDDPAFVQIWGPRFSAYVVAAEDVAPFTLGRLPDDAAGRRRAVDTAARLHELLAGRSMRYGDAGLAMGVPPNSLKYATASGTILIRWEGARQPIVWTVPRPDVDPVDARLELARRYLHVFGPTTAGSFAAWAGIGRTGAQAAFASLAPSLTPVRTAIGDGWILAEDEGGFRAPAGPEATARLLPSGDTYFLLQGVEREILVPQAERRARLWTPRVWPGAVLVDGEVVGTWRRAGPTVTVETWRRLGGRTRAAVEAEARSLPLPDVDGASIAVRWDD
jgi:winged helix DNA-binding protein